MIFTRGCNYGRTIRAYPEKGGPMGGDGTEYVIDDVWPWSLNPFKWILAFCREREVHYTSTARGYRQIGQYPKWHISERLTWLFILLFIAGGAYLLLTADLITMEAPCHL